MHVTTVLHSQGTLLLFCESVECYIGFNVRESVYLQIEHLVQDAVSKGAVVVTGGKRHALGGNYFLPTILGDVTDQMEIFHSEIFGPVASLIRCVFPI